VRSKIAKLVLHATGEQLNAASREYFVPTRARIFGGTLAEMAPRGSERRAEYIKGVVEGLKTVGQWIDMEGGGMFVGGDQPCFADCDIAATLMWGKIMDWEGEDSWWAPAEKVEGGRWRRYLEEFEKWSNVH